MPRFYEIKYHTILNRSVEGVPILDMVMVPTVPATADTPEVPAHQAPRVGRFVTEGIESVQRHRRNNPQIQVTSVKKLLVSRTALTDAEMDTLEAGVLERRRARELARAEARAAELRTPLAPGVSTVAQSELPPDDHDHDDRDENGQY